MRVYGLDLLRAAAILWVLVFHSVVLGLGFSESLFARSGWMAVDLFFVISGYLIASQLFNSLSSKPEGAIQRFYLRRFLRIVPAYLATLALYVWAVGWREAPGMQPAWEFLSYTLNYRIDYEHHRAFSHAWSLCVEEHFYLLFPWLALFAVQKASPRQIHAIIGSLLLGGIVVRFLLWYHTLEQGAVLETQPWRFVELLYYPTHVRCDGLLVGVCLAAVRSYRPAWWNHWTNHPKITAGIFLVLGPLAFWVAAPRTTGPAIVFGFPLLALAFGTLLVHAVSPRSLVTRIEIPGVRLVASLTYSVYLIHKMAWTILRLYTPSWVQGGSVVSFFAYGTAAFVAGSVLYLTIERPFLRLRES